MLVFTAGMAMGAEPAEDRMNLAGKDLGGWIVASSFADLGAAYSDNLNDGDASSVWRSAGLGGSEFIEIAWDLPRQVDEVSLRQPRAQRAGRAVAFDISLDARIRGRWERVCGPVTVAADAGKAGLDFPTLTASRLRLRLEAGEPAEFSATEVSVYGPDQPIVALRRDGRWLNRQWAYDSLGRSEPAAGADVPGPYRLAVTDVQGPDGPVAPGGDAHFTIRLRPEAPMPRDSALVLTIGRRAVMVDRTDYEIVRQILAPRERPASWPAGEARTIDVEVHLPAYAPHDELPVRLHVARPQGAEPVVLVDGEGAELTGNEIARLRVRRFEDGLPTVPELQQARIDTSLGGTVLNIDGERTAPILSALMMTDYPRLHGYSQEAGINIFHLQVYPFRSIYNDANDWRRNFDFLAGKIDALRRIDPDARVLVQMDLRPDYAWLVQHPEARLYTWDGEAKYESFAAREYVEGIREYLTELVTYIEAQPWRDRVIGYLCLIGEPEGTLSGGPDVGDYNPQAIEAFRRFVRERYGDSVERLRAAYNDESLTFEEVFPHQEQIVAAGYRGGCFLDPATQRLAIDYHAFVASMIPTVLDEVCAATIKRLTDRRVLVGSYWGYLTHNLTNNPGGFAHQKTHSWLPHILSSENLDFFSCPFSYNHRRGGDPYRLFQTFDAVRVAGKLSIAEMDNRTYRHGAKVGYRLNSVEETLGVMRMQMAKNIMHGMGYWLADWTYNLSDDRRESESAYLDEIQLAEAAKFREIYEQTLDLHRSETAEVAVLLSGPSYFYHDNDAWAFYGESIRQMLYTQLPRAGVPYDELILEQLVRPEIRDRYKCFVFLNAFHLTDEQKRAVQQIRDSGRTIVWMYAPGYAGENALRPEAIGELTGMDVEVRHEGRRLTEYALETSGHAILADVESPSFEVSSWGEMSPHFAIADDQPGVTILGRYTADGAGALAVRDETKTVYCAASYMPVDLLRGLFRWAGCHVYADEPIFLDATEHFLLVTNDVSGERTVEVRLPRPRRVVEADTREVLAEGAARISVPLEPARTRFFRLLEPSVSSAAQTGGASAPE